MENKIKDFTKIAEKYQGKWVALDEEEKEVISSSPSAKKTLKKAKKEGFTNPILFKVPTSLLPYVGSLRLNFHCLKA